MVIVNGAVVLLVVVGIALIVLFLITESPADEDAEWFDQRGC